MRKEALEKRERHCHSREPAPLGSPPTPRREGDRVRIGLMVGPEKGRYRDKVPRLVADAVAAEQAGFTSIWVPQVPNDFDALTAVALMGGATSRIELGTAVMPIQTRHPIAMAQQALANQAVCEGRFTLGLGPSHHWIVTDMLGLPYERPARLVRNYLEVLDAAFAGPGPVDVENDDFRVHNPLDVTDVVPTPILLAALAPVMLRIAGELASGTILWMADERAIGEHVLPRLTARPRPRAGPRRGSWPGSRSRCAAPTRSTRHATGRTARSDTPSTRRTTSACSSTATPPTSAISSPPATKPRWSHASVGSATPA